MAVVVPEVIEPDCVTRQALERLGTKWRVLLVYALLAGPQRPAQLRRRLPGLSQKVLTEALRLMELDGLVERTVVRVEAPQHVEYRLSELGRTLEEPLAAVCRWASAHPDAHADPRPDPTPAGG